MNLLIAGFVLMSVVGGSQTAFAQAASSIQFPANFAPGQAPCVKQADGSCVPVSATVPLPIAGKQESISLATANTPAQAAMVYGGSYSVSQGCASYGSVTVRYRGPDGATMLTLLSKTSEDSNGTTLVSLGTNAVIDAVLTGTTGCNVTLARVPN